MGDEYTQLVASVQAATDGERSDPVVTQSALLS